MKFFFDRCAPIAITGMVRAVDGDNFVIVHHDEDQRFTKTTPDTEWMKALGQDGPPPWVVISGDGRILKNKTERQVLAAANLQFFCLDKPWPNTSIYEYAWKFMKVWPRIVEMAQQGKGSVFKVSAGAALKIDRLS